MKLILSCFLLAGGLHIQAEEPLLNMRELLDAGSLQAKVVQDWHRVKSSVPTRQKLITIRVGELLPGKEYRVPVRMIVPMDRKAKGFHLTGGHQQSRIEKDAHPRGVENDLLEGGAGLVYTMVQVLGQSGQRALGDAARRKFAETLNPRYSIQYWGWPAALVRATTAAYAEKDHFEPGKVALSGGSKNGASPSVAIIHDKRMTAVHASVSPIWDSPLRLCDRKAWDQHLAAGGQQRGFSGGHFGPNFNQRALNAGHTWKELQGFTRNISDQVFISRNLKALRTRDVEMLFHPGTHDMVAYDMAWGGAHHPSIPVYLGANSGHGKKGHPKIERDQQNKPAFLLRHFFPDEVAEPLLTPPAMETKITEDVLKVTVRFAPNSGEKSGRIWWMNDRGPDGSPRYLKELIPDQNTKEMTRDAERGVWTVEIQLDSKASRIDLFSNHRKVITYRENTYPTFISSPYTRLELR